MDFFTINHVLLLDGAVCILLAILVMVFPSPQTNLIHPVDDYFSLPPHNDTRRLLAAQLFGNGGLALTIGWVVHDGGALRLAAGVRAATLLLGVSINTWQLRAGFWRPGSVYGVLAMNSVFAIVYLALAL